MKKRRRISRPRRTPEIPRVIRATLGSRREIEAKLALLREIGECTDPLATCLEAQPRGVVLMTGADLLARNEALIALFEAILRGDGLRAIEAAGDRVIEIDGRIGD